MLKKLRTFEALVIFGLYFLPILLWSVFSFSRMNHTSHWTLFSLGLVLACFGGLAINLLTRREDEESEEVIVAAPVSKEPVLPPKPVIVEPPAPHPDEALKLEIEKLEQQIEALKNSHADIVEERATEIYQLKNDLETKEKEVVQKNKELKDQKALQEELETKIVELEYEIKTLVNFNREEEFEETLALTESDASRVLKKWIEAAASLGNSIEWENSLGSSLSSTENLSKLIQTEPNALVFLYNPEEERVLSANGHTITLLGLTPEQFSSQFHTFISKESLEWHEVRQKIAQSKWAGIRLKNCKAILGSVASGPLEGHVIGIGY